jgi:hypothetical protein
LCHNAGSRHYRSPFNLVYKRVLDIKYTLEFCSGKKHRRPASKSHVFSLCLCLVIAACLSGYESWQCQNIKQQAQAQGCDLRLKNRALKEQNQPFICYFRCRKKIMGITTSCVMPITHIIFQISTIVEHIWSPYYGPTKKSKFRKTLRIFCKALLCFIEHPVCSASSGTGRPFLPQASSHKPAKTSHNRFKSKSVCASLRKGQSRQVRALGRSTLAVSR